MLTLKELWDEISLNVCRVCVDYSSTGCRKLRDGQCSLHENFADVVSAVSSVADQRFTPYVVALRERVCPSCTHQQAFGRCTVRDDVDCALDRYYPLVITTIEEALLPVG